MDIEYVKPVLSDYAIFYLQAFGKGVIAKDFIGYIFNLKPKFDVIILITLKGNFRLFSINPKKVLNKKLYKKVYKYLRKKGFTREGYNDPFPDFEPYANLKLNPFNVMVIKDKIFGKIE